jgi:peroxiredoxin
MNNPFKLFFGVGLGSVVIVGLLSWLVIARPARDELGAIPIAASGSASAPEPAPSPPPKPAAPSAPLNKPAPPLQLPGLPGITGDNFSLASYRGKAPVVLFFFATWCPHCREEAPHMSRLYEQYRDQGLMAVAITSEKPAEAAAYLKKNPLPFPVLYDKENAVAKTYGVDGIPVTCVVDREGKLVTVLQGFMEQEFQVEIASRIAPLLKS